MTLDEVRNEIDKLDEEMKELFLRRMELSGEVAKVKAGTAQKVYNPGREAEVIGGLTEGIGGPRKLQYESFLKKLMEISRTEQYRLMDESGADGLFDTPVLDEAAGKLKGGEDLRLSFTCSEKGISPSEAISVISDYSPEILEIALKESGKVEVLISGQSDAGALKLLLIHLFKETEDLRIL